MDRLMDPWLAPHPPIHRDLDLHECQVVVRRVGPELEIRAVEQWLPSDQLYGLPQEPAAASLGMGFGAVPQHAERGPAVSASASRSNNSQIPPRSGAFPNMRSSPSLRPSSTSLRISRRRSTRAAVERRFGSGRLMAQHTTDSKYY
jgi:hypothetical protein